MKAMLPKGGGELRNIMGVMMLGRWDLILFLSALTSCVSNWPREHGFSTQDKEQMINGHRAPSWHFSGIPFQCYYLLKSLFIDLFVVIFVPE